MQSTIIHIAQGKVTNPKAAENLYASLKDGKYLIEPKRIGKRSLPQNRYYFGVVVALIRDRMREWGNDVDSEAVHGYLKERFNRKDLIDGDGVLIGSVGNSTTGLGKMEFEDYLERCKRFAAEELELPIPDPNTVVPMFENY